MAFARAAWLPAILIAASSVVRIIIENNYQYIGYLATNIFVTIFYQTFGNDMFMVDIADTLKSLRKERGLSQKALADLAQVSQQTIGAIESGHTKRPQSIVGIAKALGVSPERLLDASDSLKAPEIISNISVLKLAEVLHEIFIVLQNAEVEQDKSYSTVSFALYSARLLEHYSKTGELPDQMDTHKVIALMTAD